MKYNFFSWTQSNSIRVVLVTVISWEFLFLTFLFKKCLFSKIFLRSLKSIFFGHILYFDSEANSALQKKQKMLPSKSINLF